MFSRVVGPLKTKSFDQPSIIPRGRRLQDYWILPVNATLILQAYANHRVVCVVSIAPYSMPIRFLDEQTLHLPVGVLLK